MLFLQRPTADEVHHFLRWQRSENLSYPYPCASRDESAPAGFVVDRVRTHLGFGGETFAAARAALCQWRMIPQPVCRLCWPAAPIEPGTVVATVSRAGPVWSLNACRIVYVLGQQVLEPCFARSYESKRFGFAYGTLPAHVLEGEERFTVEWRSEDDSVWYELYCFSRPRHPLARIAFPWMRWKQRQFRRLSAEAMRQAIQVAGHKPTPDCSYVAAV